MDLISNPTPLGNFGQKQKAHMDGNTRSSVWKGKAGTDSGVLCSLSSLTTVWAGLQIFHVLATALARYGEASATSGLIFLFLVLFRRTSPVWFSLPEFQKTLLGPACAKELTQFMFSSQGNLLSTAKSPLFDLVLSLAHW